MNSKMINTNIVLFCFIIASCSTLGSLFFSEIMEFIPCSMCWYQRIFMYPLVLIFLVSLLYPDKQLFKYSIVLVIPGLLFAVYHNLLMFKIIPESIVPCVQGIPCSTEYIDWFGFVTIPLLSFIGYFLIFVALVYGNKKAMNEK